MYEVHCLDNSIKLEMTDEQAREVSESLPWGFAIDEMDGCRTVSYSYEAALSYDDMEDVIDLVATYATPDSYAFFEGEERGDFWGYRVLGGRLSMCGAELAFR